MKAQRDSFNYIGRNQKKYGTNIINAGYDSMVESFPKVDFIKSLGLSDEEVKYMFEDLLSEKTEYKSVSDFYEKCYELKNADQIAEYTDKSFYTEAEVGVSLIKKIINTHLPLGPYDGKYFFALRQ